MFFTSLSISFLANKHLRLFYLKWRKWSYKRFLLNIMYILLSRIISGLRINILRRIRVAKNQPPVFTARFYIKMMRVPKHWFLFNIILDFWDVANRKDVKFVPPFLLLKNVQQENINFLDLDEILVSLFNCFLLLFKLFTAL